MIEDASIDDRKCVAQAVCREREVTIEMTKQSPLKARPLRNPGQGLDEELQQLWDDRAAPYFWFPALFCLLAAIEWFAYLRGMPRQPVAYTIAAVVFAVFGGVRLWQIGKRYWVPRLERARP